MNKTKIACALLLTVAACGNGNAADRYQVVPGESELRVLVFRAGTLSALAHNHVVSSRELSGTVTDGASPGERGIDVRLRANSLVVDDPAVRAEEGRIFSAAVSEKEMQGTRRNMLGGKLLQADRFGEIRIVSNTVSGDFPELNIEAEVTIRGERHTVDIPVIVEKYEDRLVATGTTEITHAQLGLSPFTAAFGAMRVGERMTFRYRVVAIKPGGNE